MTKSSTDAPHFTAATGAEYNPFDPAFNSDPYAFYAKARREAPVCFCPLYGVWVITGHQEIITSLKDPQIFSSADALKVPFPLPAEVQAVLDGGDYPIAPGLFNNDPPGHTRNRALASTAFTPARIAAMEPTIRALAHGLVDAFAKDGRADIVSQLAYPLPMTIIADLLGIPRSDMPQVKKWNDDWQTLFAPGLPLEKQLDCARSLVDFQRYYRAMIEDRRQSPRDDLMTALVQARVEGEKPFTVPEIVSQAMILLSAAHETTTGLIGSMCHLLLQQPDRWRAVSEDPSLVAAAIEESLRFEPPVAMEARFTTEPTELGGVSLPKGARLHVMFGSINRDPAYVDDPDTFDLRRASAKHMAFGYGIHYCLGAALGRLEARVAVETLKERLPGLRLAPGFAVEHIPSFYFRQPKRIDVVWDVGAEARGEVK